MPRSDSEDDDARPGRDADILTELEAVGRAVSEYCATAPAGQAREERILGIMRLCPELDPGRWSEIAARHGLSHWVSFAVGEKDAVDVQHLLETIRDLSRQTDHDALTGLPNRRYLDRAMQIEMERSRRAGVAFCLARLNIDGFTALNEAHGRECGDQVLISLARLLSRQKRIFDLSARLGGGDFALMLPGAGLLKAGAMLEKILEAVRAAEIARHGAPPLRVTLSVGIACFKGRKVIETAELHGLAEAALAEAKAAGGNGLALAPLPELAALEDEAAQVHPREKRFLFGERK